MADYWSGLVEGFQGSRERNYEKRFKEEQENRARADRLFSYLLASRDPEMQSMAISGLMNPIHRKKGFSGFMGEVDKDPYAAQIVSAINEMVPDHSAVSSAPTPPTPGPGVGGAGMSTNQPVRLGSENLNPDPAGAATATPGIQLPPEPPPAVGGVPGGMPSGAGEHANDIPMPPMPTAGAGPQAQAQLGPQGQAGPGGIPMPPMPPQQVESKWKRRGTGVPTAEEIAEETARRKIQVPVQLAQGMLAAGQNGITADDVHRITMDAMGVPMGPHDFREGAFAVILPTDPSNTPQPVSFDTSRGMYFLSDGKTPVPTGSKFVRMTGAGAGGGSGLTSTVRDTPQVRAQYGIDADVPSTGYLKIKQLPDGTIQALPTTYTPPPAFSTGPTVLDQSGNATATLLSRGGQLVPAGTAPGVQPSTEQSQAQAVLEVVRQRVRAAERPYGSTQTLSLQPKQVDDIVRTAAKEAGLPYVGLIQLEQAAKVPNARQVEPRKEAPPGAKVKAPGQSMADKVRQDLLKSKGMAGPAIPSPPGPPATPPPPQRMGGPGPVGARP